MTDMVAFKPGHPGGFQRLADMVTSPDERIRCLGRAFTSGIVPALEAGLRAEQERGTESLVILEVVATLGVQHVASVAAHVVRPSGDDAVRVMLERIVESRFPEYLAAVRAIKEGGAT